jgi:hypothetical protein
MHKYNSALALSYSRKSPNPSILDSYLFLSHPKEEEAKMKCVLSLWAVFVISLSRALVSGQDFENGGFGCYSKLLTSLCVGTELDISPLK